MTNLPICRDCQVLRAMIVAASRPQDVATAALLGTSELVKQEGRDGKVNRSNISNGDLIKGIS